MKTDPLGTTGEAPSSTGGTAEQELRIELVDKGDGAATLLLKGELDIAGFPLLESCLTRVESENQGNVIVDLEDLRFMDGSGLHAISHAAARAANSGWTFRIVNAQGSVKRLFSLICPEMLADGAARHDGQTPSWDSQESRTATAWEVPNLKQNASYRG